MILTRYLLKRLFLYFFLINGSLALLYNIVEFFEKLIRIHQTSLLTILSFVVINIFPTFFDLIPLASWVASCLMIREIYERGEWESILLLGISPLRLLKLFLVGGLTITILSFVGKEIIVAPLAEKAETLRLEEFKHNAHTTLYNQWITRDESLFIHFDSLNITQGTGENITLLFFRPDFTIEKEITAPRFSLVPKKHSIIISEASSLWYDTAYKEQIMSEELSLPPLFLYLQTVGGTKRLTSQFRALIDAYHSSIPYFFNQELGTLLERFLKHLHPLFYYVVTLFLFLSLYSFERIRWLIILIPYPYLLISTNAAIFLMRHNGSAFLLFVPYLLILVGMFLFFFSASFFSFLKLQIEKK